MGRKSTESKSALRLSINSAQARQVAELQQTVKGGHADLQALKLALRTPEELAQREVKKKRSRAKSKAARAARKKNRS